MIPSDVRERGARRATLLREPVVILAPHVRCAPRDLIVITDETWRRQQVYYLRRGLVMLATVARDGTVTNTAEGDAYLCGTSVHAP